MTIDIIDLTDPQYADLSSIQLAMVRVAQGKKDAIIADLKLQEKNLYEMLLANRNARSSAYTRETNRMKEEASAEVERLREDLLYQLAYESLGTEGNDRGPYRYPENPNYSLAYTQRFLVVRNYYMTMTNDPETRLQAYAADSLAQSYLGEFYQTLYDMLASYC